MSKVRTGLQGAGRGTNETENKAGWLESELGRGEYKRYGDEVAEVSKSPHHLGGQARGDSCSPHWITSPAGHSDLKTMHLADDGGCAGRAQWIGLAFELF
jgi:hypothetical protein